MPRNSCKTSKPVKHEYRVEREWVVTMSSVAYVVASSPEEACELAMDEDFDDQEICDDSDGPTYVHSITNVTTGTSVPVPEHYQRGEDE